MTIKANGGKRGRGRPRLPDDVRLGGILSVRVNRLEQRELKARAMRAGLTVRDYVRHVLGWEKTT